MPIYNDLQYFAGNCKLHCQAVADMMPCEKLLVYKKSQMAYNNGILDQNNFTSDVLVITGSTLSNKLITVSTYAHSSRLSQTAVQVYITL